MKIRFLHGPRKGEVDHAPLSQETKLLLGAGLIEEIPLTDSEKAEIAKTSGHTIPPHYATPVWDVIRTVESGMLVVVRKCGTETTYFDGPPDRKRWDDCPQDIVKKFAAMKRENEPSSALPFAGRNWRERLPQ